VTTGSEIPTGLTGETIAPPGLVSLSRCGRLLAAGGADGSIRVWDWPRGRPRERLFITAGVGDLTRLYEKARTRTTVFNPFLVISREFAGGMEEVRAVAFSPDGRWLAAAGKRGSVQVWEIDGWRPHLSLTATGHSMEWLAFTPDSGRLALPRGGQVEIWDLSRRELHATLEDRDGSPVLGGAIAPDGHLLATGAKDRQIRLWDLKTGELRTTLSGHQDQVTTVAFAPDGKTLASGSADRSVRLWSLAAPHDAAVLQAHAGKVRALAFSPDGRVLASGSSTGEVALWRAPRP
jgi:WD40 repeat protein